MIAMQKLPGQDIYAGFIEDTIHGFAAKNRTLFAERSALITCVDSDPSPGKLPEWIKLLDIHALQYEVIDNFVWINKPHALKAIEAPGVFPKFSELYLVHTLPQSVAGLAKRFTSDGTQFVNGVPDDVSAQMNSIHADGYLSDGCGLNIALNKELLKYVTGNA